MSLASGAAPKERFTGLADIYAQHRPAYPAAALAHIVQRCGLGPASLLVDVGCGTGISSRQFALLGVPVLGIEPNADMRRYAAAATLPANCPAPQYRAGSAEATGLPTGCATVVLAAQAFHWFDPPLALREFRRLLQPGGWVALLWHERDEADPFTAAYGAVARSTREAAAVEQSWRRTGDPLLASPDFQHGERTSYAHEQALDEAGLIGRALSVSYAPRAPAEVEPFTAALKAVFARFQQAGQVVLRYRTSVALAQRCR